MQIPQREALNNSAANWKLKRRKEREREATTHGSNPLVLKTQEIKTVNFKIEMFDGAGVHFFSSQQVL